MSEINRTPINVDKNLSKVNWTELLVLEAFKRNVTVYKMKAPVDMFHIQEFDKQIKFVAATVQFVCGEILYPEGVCVELIDYLRLKDDHIFCILNLEYKYTTDTGQNIFHLRYATVKF